LCVKRKKHKRLVSRGLTTQMLSRANQGWALDFVHDVLGTGQRVRVLSVLDAYTRKCLGLEVDTSFASRRVTRVLERLIAERGRPESLRCDNGPELTSRHFLGLVRGAEDSVGAHRTGPADAERAGGELSG